MSAEINGEVLSIEVDGIKVPHVDGSWTMTFGGDENTPVVGGKRLRGFSSTFVPGVCGFTVAYTAGFDPRVLRIKNSQVSVTWDAGATWLLTSATLTNTIDISAPEGSIEVTYSGDEWEPTDL